MNTREQIFKTIEDAAQDAFLKAQRELNIESGDIEPLDDLWIENHINNLSEYIFKVIEVQYNRKNERR
jgi:hypothetical protein